MKYRRLDAEYITATLRILKNRIFERFPKSNLNNVCQELVEIAAASEDRIRRIHRPRWLLRLGIAVVIGLMVAATASAMFFAFKEVPLQFGSIAELLQGLDAGVNEAILLSIALVFLPTLENRIQRGQLLRALHDFRSIAHVIDMHQLSKDPEAILFPGMATASSPHRAMTRFELSRYLDYCAEMLSLTSKLAALYVQHERDPALVSAVSDIENLTAGLSQKIWQKITILDIEAARHAQREEPASDGAAVALDPSQQTQRETQSPEDS